MTLIEVGSLILLLSQFKKYHAHPGVLTYLTGRSHRGSSYY